MRTKVVTSVLVFVNVLCLVGCGGEQVQSTWARTPLTIDGSTDDWKDATSVVFKDEHLALSVENDSAYLYLSGRISDEGATQAIERAGITVWVDRSGGASKDLEIHFPVGRSVEFRETRAGFWDALTDDERARASKGIDEMRKGVLVIDNRSITSHIFPAQGPAGFSAGAGGSSGIATFEVRIPIGLQEYFPGFASVSENNRIGLGIQFGEIGGEAGDGMGNGGQGAGPRRGRGWGSFGMPGRGRQPNESSSEIWAEVILASAK
jgi:hypothetical protein